MNKKNAAPKKSKPVTQATEVRRAQKNCRLAIEASVPEIQGNLEKDLLSSQCVCIQTHTNFIQLYKVMEAFWKDIDFFPESSKTRYREALGRKCRAFLQDQIEIIHLRLRKNAMKKARRYIKSIGLQICFSSGKSNKSRMTINTRGHAKAVLKMLTFLKLAHPEDVELCRDILLERFRHVFSGNENLQLDFDNLKSTLNSDFWAATVEYAPRTLLWYLENHAA